jgi:hypothetical protein
MARPAAIGENLSLNSVAEIRGNSFSPLFETAHFL